MPCSQRTILVLLFISLTAACSIQESRPLAPTQSGALVTPSAVSPSPDTSPLVIVTPRSPSTSGSEASSVTPSLTLTASIASLEWTTYHDPKGVIIEYPVGYEVRSFPWNYVRFDAPSVDAELPKIRETFALEVSLRSLADREIANPYSWQDASVKVHWGTSIAVEGAEGWLFVWGEENFDGRFPDPGLWQRSATLMAIYYNEQNQVDVRITTSFDDESTLLAQEIGLAETVAQQYPIFDHVVKSVSFVEPAISPEQALAQLLAASPAPLETLITPSGVAVEYPSSWEIQEAPWEQQPFDWFGFLAPGEEGQSHEIRTQIILTVKPLPLTDLATANPYTWMPNEGGYEAHWLTPIQVEGAQGWLFVWGASTAGRLDVESGLWVYTPSLMAIYYNEQNQVDVRITTSFDDESTLLAQEIGLAETVAQRYPIFDHVVKSVRFVEPAIPPEEALAQLLAASPAPPETLITSNGVAVEYPGDWEVQRAPVEQPFDQFTFLIPGEAEQPTEPQSKIVLEVKPLPLVERGTIDPQSWLPNEQGYEAHWLTPIQVEGAEGWLFVWGASNFEGQEPGAALWRETPSLMAIYYNQERELAIQLTTTFDDESTRLAQGLGLAETVAIRYALFEHMVKSMHFVGPTQP